MKIVTSSDQYWSLFLLVQTFTVFLVALVARYSPTQSKLEKSP